jgi:hypothetical protein
MGAIFVSYRRGDSEGQAKALYIQLAELIGKDSVFIDPYRPRCWACRGYIFT